MTYDIRAIRRVISQITHTRTHTAHDTSVVLTSLISLAIMLDAVRSARGELTSILTFPGMARFFLGTGKCDTCHFALRRKGK